MKEKPILFSTPMVQAILDGRKTQTRRIIKPQPESVDHVSHKTIPYNGSPEFLLSNLKCPYGQIGDMLWVRETWWHNRETWGDSEVFLYRADFPIDGYDHVDAYKWKPSIFMPKDVCRIKLRITDIRVERLQDISEEGAIAEGVGSGFQMNAGYPDYEHIVNGVCTITQDTAKMSYWSLWDSINGKGSWDKNPWVWVITFERITNP